MAGASERSAKPASVKTSAKGGTVVVPKLRAWHHALGAALAWLVIVIAVTGAVLVYKNQIVLLTVAAGAKAPAEGYQPHVLADELDRIVERIPTSEISRLNAPVPERPYWTVVQSDGSSRILDLGSLEERTNHLWVLRTLDFIRAVHVDLLLHTTGEWILLLLGLMLVFFGVSGLLMWWPARRHFKLDKLIPSKMTRQQLLISHRQLGAVLAPVILLTAVTGGVMLGNGFVRQLVLTPTKPDVQQLATASSPVSEQLPPGQLLMAAFNALPEATLTLVSLPNEASGQATFRMRLPGEWHPNGRTRVPVDAVTGVAEEFERSDQASWGMRLLNQMYPLHSAYGLNNFFRLSVFLGGVVVVWLSASGFIGWLSKKRKQRQRASVSAQSAAQLKP